MLVLVLLAILVFAGLLVLVGGRWRGDGPARITAVAAGRLQPQREDWGPAVVAELSGIQGRGHRWRFALGVLWVALFPPPRHGRRSAVVAMLGLAVAVAATVVAAVEVPNLTVFVAVLGALLCGYATVVAARWRPARPTAARVAVGLLGLGGAAAMVGSVVAVAVAHPAAARDGAHVFSVAFAAATVGYLALALTPPRLSGGRSAPLWWAVGATAVSGAVWAVTAFDRPAPDSVAGYWWVGVVATVAVSIGAAATARDQAAGIKAGLLTIALAMPVRFAIDMAALLSVRHYVLTDPYDQAAFPRSGFPDVASYLLSDSMGGEILAGLVIFPIGMFAIAVLGATAGGAIHRGPRRDGAGVVPT